MRRLLKSIVCSGRAYSTLLAAPLLALNMPASSAATFLIRGGTLIDGTGKAPIQDARILVEGNTIQKVWSGEAAGQNIPPGAQVIDAGGKFIIPGLIDSHVHYNWYMGELFLAHGVTTVYGMGGGGGAWHIAVKKGLNSGKLRGPRYYHSGSLGGGGGEQPRRPGAASSFNRGATVNTPEDAKAAVTTLKGKTDFITLNESWKGEHFTAVAREAHAAGISIISHSFNAVDSATWGVDGIEHMTGVGMAAVRSPEGRKAMAGMTIEAGHKNSLLYQWMDQSVFDEMIQHLVKHNVFLNPTLDFEWKGIINRTPEFELEDQRLLFNPLLQYVPMDERLVTLGQYHWADKRSSSDREQFLKGYKNVQEFLRRFVEAGGKLYSGTDSAAANTPGLALHHEMQMYVDAGIPAMRALQSSTKWAAELVHLDKQLGTVEPNKFADLLILRGNPLDDIRNTKAIDRVIKGGEIVDTSYHADYEVPFHQFGPVGKHLYNQPPVVKNIEPGFAVQGKEVRIRVSGMNFVPSSVVLFGGSPVETKFVSATELSAVLTKKQTSQVGNILIGVQTPKPGGGVTEGLGFIVDYP
jgi:hypothetical protein